MDRTKTTFSQNYYLNDLRDDIRTHIRIFNTCQRNKKQTLNMAN